MAVGAGGPASDVVVFAKGEKAHAAVEDGPADMSKRQITEPGVTLDPSGGLAGGNASLFGEHPLGLFDYGSLAVVDVSGWFLDTVLVGTSGVKLQRGPRLIGIDGEERHSAHHQAVEAHPGRDQRCCNR